MVMLVAAALVVALAPPPGLDVRSPYLDVVRQYGPGTETRAIAALHALRVRDPDEVFAELDANVCRAAGARSCHPHHLIAAGRESQRAVAGTWRRLYPRALALHVDALATSDPTVEADAIRLHRIVVLRLIARIERVAREQRDMPPDFSGVALRGRRLLLWALQYLRDVKGLASVVEQFEAAKIQDVELRLSRGALEELLALPDAVAEQVESDRTIVLDVFARNRMLAQEERRRIERAAGVYEQLLAEHPALLEAHLRRARLLLRLGRPEPAERHLARVAGLRPDPRQAYLAALFLADVFERQGRVLDAIAAYGVAQQNWPRAQAPGIGVARLRALSSAHADARAALSGLHLERAADTPERSDPWNGYLGGQSWRLPAAMAALQASFEAEP
jgi:tetratricopeptide (TPR) repeat protein